MKKIHYLLFCFIAVIFASCENYVTYNDDYDDGTSSDGPPSIAKVSPVTDRKASLTYGELNQMIIIQGKNLSPVVSLLFNDVAVDMKTFYARSAEIVVPVPRIIPGNINNKITLTTELGTTTFDFPIEIPSVKIDGLSNEFAEPGDTINIMGDYFDLWEVTKESGTVKLNAQVLEIIEATATNIKIAIPENYDSNPADIFVSSPKLDNPVKILFHNSGNTICLDNPTFSFVGNYPAWSWLTSDYLKYTISDQDIIDHPENYYFKFEMLTNKPINVVGLHFYIAFGPDVVYSWNNMLIENGGVELYTNKKWATKSFSLLDFPNTRDKFTTLGEYDFVILFQPHDQIDSDFKFRNFRIAKN